MKVEFSKRLVQRETGEGCIQGYPHSATSRFISEAVQIASNDLDDSLAEPLSADQNDQGGCRQDNCQDI